MHSLIQSNGDSSLIQVNFNSMMGDLDRVAAYRQFGIYVRTTATSYRCDKDGLGDPVSVAFPDQVRLSPIGMSYRTGLLHLLTAGSGTYSPSRVIWREGRSRRRSRKCWPCRRRSSTPSHTHRKPDLAAGRGSIHTLQHQFKTEGQLELADHHDRRLLSAQRDQFTAADLTLYGEAERRDSVSPAHRALSQAFSPAAACGLRRMSVMSTSVARDRLDYRTVGEERTTKF